MSRYLLAAVALTFTLAHDPSAHAFWCGNRTVQIGDPQIEVRSLCGEPAGVSERVVTRTVGVQQRVTRGIVVQDAVTVTVVVEIWLYDFGPRRFMQELAFEGGRVIAMEALGYGTARGREASLRAPIETSAGRHAALAARPRFVLPRRSA
jgi:hypothetical protein